MNVEMMVRAIEAEPDDLTAEWALTEALVEEREMTYPEAERHARNVVRSARDARDLAAAADLMTPDKPWHLELCTEIIQYCFLDPREGATIVVVAGNSMPVAASEHHWIEGNFFPTFTITVGALWVLGRFRGNAHWQMLKAKMKSKKSKSK